MNDLTTYYIDMYDHPNKSYYDEVCDIPFMGRAGPCLDSLWRNRDFIEMAWDSDIYLVAVF